MGLCLYMKREYNELQKEGSTHREEVLYKKQQIHKLPPMLQRSGVTFHFN